MNFRRPLLWVICFGVVLSLPVLLAGFPFSTHDASVHEVWYSNFAAQLWSGELYPRWLQNLDGGLGGPSFYFYPPAPFFITSLFQPLFHDAHSWHVLGVSAALALVLSGVFAYVWLNPLTTARSAAIAAILYVAMPYHFAIDLHTRGAFGEVWSFVWMPLVLFFAQRISRRERFAGVGLAMSYAMLILTHLPTTLMFSLIPPAWALWVASRGERVRTVLWTGIAMTLGIGLASIYLLPAMLDQASASVQTMRQGDFYYANWFFLPDLLSGKLTLSRRAFEGFLLWVTLATAGLGAFAWHVVRRAHASPFRRAAAFWGAIAMVSIAMMLPIAKPVYEIIPPLQMIQFPWRFNAILAVAVVALLATGLAALERVSIREAAGAFVAGAGFVVLWGVFTASPLRYTSFSRNSHLSGWRSDWKANNWNTIEYRPRWAAASAQQILARVRSPGTKILPKARIINDSGSVAVNRWKPRDIRLLFDGPTDMIVEISQYFYPGWAAVLDEKDRLRVAPSPNALVQVTVPRGAHTLDLRLEKSRAEAWGARISAGALVILIGAATLGALSKSEQRLAS